MRNICFLFIVSALLCSLSANAERFNTTYITTQASIDTLRKGDFTVIFLNENDEQVPVDVQFSLKKHEFPWGTALAFYNGYDDIWYKGVARKFFNYGVTENAFKWSSMQPNNSAPNYSDVNAYLDWCDEAGWEMRGHTLLWGSKDYDDFHPLQQWVKDLPQEDIDDTCKVRVQREMEYYKGRIKEYDVINEAIPYHANYLQRTIGDSINWNCFKWAKEIDPNAALFINDYNIITGGNDQYKYMTLIKEIIANGGPIDGVGVQAHFGSSVNAASMTYILDTLATLGLSLKITEFDMDVEANNLSEEQQASDYALAMRVAFAHPAVDAFLFWGFWDSRHWRGGAGMFNEDKSPKLAADSVYNLIHNTWSTKGAEENCDILDVNAYYGTYEMYINYDNKTLVYDVDMSHQKESDTVKVRLKDGEYPSPKIISASVISTHEIRVKFDQELTFDNVSNTSFYVNGNRRYTLTDAILNEDDNTEAILNTLVSMNAGERMFLTYDDKVSLILGDNDKALEYIANYEMENNIPASLNSTIPDPDIKTYYDNGSIIIVNHSEMDTYEIVSMTGVTLISGEVLKDGKTTIAASHLIDGIYIGKMMNAVSNAFVTSKIIIN